MSYDSASVRFGMWLENATREELINYILNNLSTNDNSSIDSIDHEQIWVTNNYPDETRTIRLRDVVATYLPHEKVQSIKSLRSVTGCSLKTAKEAVEKFQAEFYPYEVARMYAHEGGRVPQYLRDNIPYFDLMRIEEGH